MGLTKLYLKHNAILWGGVFTLATAIVVAIATQDRSNMIDYYCSPNSLFLGIRFSQSSLAVYCDFVVAVVHVIASSVTMMGILLILALLLDGVGFVFNPKRQKNKEIIKCFLDLFYRPRIKYSLVIIPSENKKDICIHIASSWINKEFELTLEYDKFRAFKDEKLDAQIARDLLDVKMGLFNGKLKGNKSIDVKIGEVRELNKELAVNFPGFVLKPKRHTEYTYYFCESGIYRKQKFSGNKKSLKFSFKENGKIEV